MLTVGSDTAFPPFESMNGAVAEGFDVDLANAIAKEMGLTVNFTSQTFDTLIPQLKAGGTFDVIMSGMTITADRKKEITFSTPYIDSNQSIAVVKGKFPKVDGNDAAAINTAFTGKIIGVQSGTTGEAWAKENIKGAKQIMPFDDTLSAFSALNAGKVDAVVNDLPVSAYLVKDLVQGRRAHRRDPDRRAVRHRHRERQHRPASTAINDALRQDQGVRRVQRRSTRSGSASSRRK